ncbi:MAG: DUF1549 and DUF1553 domain-containing protein [Gemmataceae bacterium]
MKAIRFFGLLALTAGVILADFPAEAADPPKTPQQIKKEKRQKLKAALAEKTAAATPPAVQQAPAPKRSAPVPADPAGLAKLIDDEVNAKLAAEKVMPAAKASDAEFLRRAYLDLTGVIPTAAQARAFLEDKDPAKRARLIDELLASPKYGRHLADIWQAKLLPRDSDNRFIDRKPMIDWLAEQFNHNTPWDKVVREIVTATGTQDKNPAVTYFLTNRSVDKLTDSVTQHFLGVRLGCAQCHNHPFTAWKQTEYWGMAAFFSKVQPDRGIRPAKADANYSPGVRELPVKSRAKDFFPESAKTVPAKFLSGDTPKISGSEAYRPHLANWMTSPDNPYFARAMVNRTWAQLFGRGFVNPVDDMHDDNSASHPELLDALAKRFAASGFDLKALTKAICLSDAYGRSSKPAPGSEKADPALFARVQMKVMSAEQLFDSLGQVTGQPAAMAQGPKKGAGAAPGLVLTPRDRFVQFYLAGRGGDEPDRVRRRHPAALKLMNSRLAAAAGRPPVRQAGAAPGRRSRSCTWRRLPPADTGRAGPGAEVRGRRAPRRSARRPAGAAAEQQEFAMVR